MKIKLVVWTSLISINVIFSQDYQDQDERRIHRYSCCSDGIGDDLPPVGGTIGCVGLLFKGTVCCLTSQPFRENSCCYKFDCNYSWFPPCNQITQCVDGTIFHGGPVQWVTTGIVVAGCGVCLPWAFKKYRQMRYENQNDN